jgi:probable rRNA maturation factor
LPFFNVDSLWIIYELVFFVNLHSQFLYMAIHFFKEEIVFSFKQNKERKVWIKQIAADYDFKIGDLNYIFCSDEYLKQVNIDYLNHDYYTDIITFDNSEDESKIEGDIYISIDRVKENASSFSQDFETELNRVLIHGLLHLIGFGDKTSAEEKNMRKLESEAILKFSKN